jgi:hypothetical protein
VIAAVAAVVVALLGLVPAGGQTGALPPPAPNTDLGTVVSPHHAISNPYVYVTNTWDFLYASGSSSLHVPVMPFKLLGDWASVRDAMPTPPPWVDLQAGPITDPSVTKMAGRYVMWFTAVWNEPNFYHADPECIGVATASNPRGPFTDPGGTRPLVCQLNDDGDSAARPIRIDGRRWLLWSSDNSTVFGFAHTRIWAQRLTPGGRGLRGQPVTIFKSQNTWEGYVVQSPQMVTENGRDYLFFSGGEPFLPQAGIGLATCAGPRGRCTSSYLGPFLGPNHLGAGPIGESLFTQNGATWLLYDPQADYYAGAVARLAVARVVFGPHRVYISTSDGAKPGV